MKGTLHTVPGADAWLVIGGRGHDPQPVLSKAQADLLVFTRGGDARAVPLYRETPAAAAAAIEARVRESCASVCDSLARVGAQVGWSKVAIDAIAACAIAIRGCASTRPTERRAAA